MGKKEFSEYLRSRIGASRNAKSNLARELGVHGSNITKYLKGVNIPTMDKAMRIAAILGDDPRMVLQLAGYEEVPLGDESRAPQVRKVPLAGSVEGGKIKYAPAYMEDIYTTKVASKYIELKELEASRNDYGLRLQGDSLFPAFPEGSILLISPGKPFAPNTLCAVKSSENLAWIRFVTVFNSIYTLASVNPGYPPFSLDKEDIAFIHPVKWVMFP